MSFFSFISIALLDFPSCVIGEQPELTAETLEIGDTSQFCWRNIFSCINLLRVLNKLTKWKQSRIMVSKHETEKKRGSLIMKAFYQIFCQNKSFSSKNLRHFFILKTFTRLKKCLTLKNKAKMCSKF